MKFAVFCYLPAILLIALIACSNTDDPIIDEDLLGVVWRVDTLHTPDSTIVTGPDEIMTIQFSENLDLDGRTVCRSYEGEYVINVIGAIAIDNLVREPIELACIGRLGLLETSFLHGLENVSAYDIAESRLTLHDSNYQYVLKFRTE